MEKRPKKRPGVHGEGELSIRIRTSEVSISLKSLNAMNEAEISDKITTLLLKHGITPYQQHPIPSARNARKIGNCDLYIYDKRTIIEVKKVKRLEMGPHDEESGDGTRSAFQQLAKYVTAERAHANSRIADYAGDRDVSGRPYLWVGIVTNYKKWWAWTWPQYESADDGKLQDSFNGVELTVPKEKQLVALLLRKEAKPVPEDLGPMFEPHLERFTALHGRLKDYRDTQTQKGLWLRQLEASGNAPDADVDEIFVRHTLLILVTRLISKAVGGHEADVLTQGFVSWVGDGREEVKSLAADINAYDWNHETRDIMRSLYMGFIPKKHRKSYGEYYTPDWLAEKIAMTAIDEKYVRKQLESFQSSGTVKPVLDPACGSGSLLYHAGRFILNSKAVSEARLYASPAKINEFLCAMLCGIDIHPVAVEMARTNIHRLIRYATDQRINVYQGDSLLLDRPTDNVHSAAIADPDDLVLYSPRGAALVLPRSLLKSPEGVEVLARTAKEGIAPPKSLTERLNAKDAKKAVDAHGALVRIMDREGDGVWEWYIKNQAAPLLLRERKAGRIISNPPWVRTSLINSRNRKALIESEARRLGLWVGGNTATSFDVAALFVDRCSSLYLERPRKSAWILIGGALEAKAWQGLRDGGAWGDYKASWDLGSAAFDMGFSTCVAFLGISTPSRKLVKKPGTSLRPNEFLSDIRDKASWEKPDGAYPKHQSGYVANRRAAPRNGATLFPYNLVRIKEIVSEKTGGGGKMRLSSPRWSRRASGTSSAACVGPSRRDG